jgi:hypothetical protein
MWYVEDVIDTRYKIKHMPDARKGKHVIRCAKHVIQYFVWVLCNSMTMTYDTYQ